VKTYLWMAIVFLFLTALFVGCKPKPKTEGGGAPALTLSPEGASPGMVVRVTTAQPAFSDITAARVEIGGQPAPIVKAVSATEVDVLVPNVAAGESRVKMIGGKVSEAAPFTVLPASAQELVLQLKDGRFELVAVHPTADEPNMVTRSQEPQLSYDLLNAQGGLVSLARSTIPRRRGWNCSMGRTCERRSFAKSRHTPGTRLSSHLKSRSCRAARP
jgi:hypothetical protein